MGSRRAYQRGQAGFISWTGVFLLLILAGAVWHFVKPERGAGTARPSQGISAERMAAIAATVKEGDVVMYSTSTCGYCVQAAQWLHQYGFVFKDCNMTNDRHCEREFAKYGGDGTPYLVVRGHHMRNGFDSDEFIAALEK